MKMGVFKTMSAGTVIHLKRVSSFIKKIIIKIGTVKSWGQMIKKNSFVFIDYNNRYGSTYCKFSP